MLIRHTPLMPYDKNTCLDWDNFLIKMLLKIKCINLDLALAVSTLLSLFCERFILWKKLYRIWLHHLLLFVTIPRLARNIFAVPCGPSFCVLCQHQTCLHSYELTLNVLSSKMKWTRLFFSIWECSGWFSDQTKTFQLSHPITHFGGLPSQATFRIPVKMKPFPWMRWQMAEQLTCL